MHEYLVTVTYSSVHPVASVLNVSLPFYRWLLERNLRRRETMNYTEKEAGMWTKDVLEILDTPYWTCTGRRTLSVAMRIKKKKSNLVLLVNH